jgi:aryl-alcohol dehydrogenase-like predicted oxidoreductase
MTSAHIDHISLPGVDTPLTRIVLGTMSMGDTADAAASEEIFEAAMAAGVTGVDCANGYASGTTEALIAPFVKRHRDHIVLATKAGIPHQDSQGLPPLSRKALLASVEGSLRRLQVEYIDLFYLHQPDRQTPLEETLGAVAELHRSGKIRALGTSNYAAWQALDVIGTGERVGAPAPVVAQNVYNLLARRIEDEWVEFARTHGLLTMCFNPLAGGLLAGLADRAGVPARYGETSSLAEMYRKRYWLPEFVEAARALEVIAVEAGLTPAQLGLRWLVSQPGAGAILIGGDRVAHVHSNLAALAEGPLPGDVLAACARVSDPLKGPMPPYSR